MGFDLSRFSSDHPEKLPPRERGTALPETPVESLNRRCQSELSRFPVATKAAEEALQFVIERDLAESEDDDSTETPPLVKTPVRLRAALEFYREAERQRPGESCAIPYADISALLDLRCVADPEVRSFLTTLTIMLDDAYIERAEAREKWARNLPQRMHEESIRMRNNAANQGTPAS